MRILNIFNTHTGRGKKVFLKKLTMVYIQKGLTLGYTTQALNIFYSHSFSNVGLTHYFFFLRILSIFNTHTGREKKQFILLVMSYTMKSKYIPTVPKTTGLYHEIKIHLIVTIISINLLGSLLNQNPSHHRKILKLRSLHKKNYYYFKSFNTIKNVKCIPLYINL